MIICHFLLNDETRDILGILCERGVTSRIVVISVSSLYCVEFIQSKAEEAMLRACQFRVGLPIPKLSSLSTIPSIFSFSFPSHSHSKIHTFSYKNTFHFHSPSSLPLSPFTSTMPPKASGTHSLQNPLFIFHFLLDYHLLT